MERVKLNTTKQYYVWRIGFSTKKVTQGKVYVLSRGAGFYGHDCWIIKNTDKKGVGTQPALTLGSKMWEVMGEVEPDDKN